MKKIFAWVILVVFLLAAFPIRAETFTPGKIQYAAVAIFTDQKTFEKIRDALFLYKNTMEEDGLSAYLVVEDWQNPEEVKSCIMELVSQKPPLEGIVLVGDIPVPMILDAQHLTSAFKIDQKRYPKQRTAVPSDRFYDDFHLRFEFVARDTARPLLFYYSLSPDSPQRINADIYSGRIKSSVDDESKYAILDRYLRRIAIQKQQQIQLDHMLLITGHGYHSESLTAWSNEVLELREHFPALFGAGGRLINLYHQMDMDLKKQTILQLQDSSLDMAIIHAHGDDDMQYLSSLPKGRNVRENIEAIKYYLRGKLRDARKRKRSVQETMNYYKDSYGVPESWFGGAFEDSIMAADSLLNYNLDIHVEDVRNISPAADFIVFDQCFNGAFIHSPYIAGEYVFGHGRTVAAAANSVNIIQDLWTDEFAGLLALGVRAGFWNQQRNFLESHIIGDPTFHFTPADGSPDKLITGLNSQDPKIWRTFLNSASPVLRSLAVFRIFDLEGKAFESELTYIYYSDPAFIVRLQALKSLAVLRSSAFHEIIKSSVYDSFELIRRFSVKWMGDIGDDEYLPFLMENLFLDPARRVNTSCWNAISKIGSQLAVDILPEQIARLPENYDPADVVRRLRSQARSDSSWLYGELIPALENDTLNLRKRISAARTFRNYRFQEAIPFLIAAAAKSDNPEKFRVAVVEALGWYTFNFRRHRIMKACEILLSDKNLSPSLAAEVLKTMNRLREGANNPLVP
jgi:hypothetical protein